MRLQFNQSDVTNLMTEALDSQVNFHELVSDAEVERYFGTIRDYLELNDYSPSLNMAAQLKLLGLDLPENMITQARIVLAIEEIDRGNDSDLLRLSQSLRILVGSPLNYFESNIYGDVSMTIMKAISSPDNQRPNILINILEMAAYYRLLFPTSNVLARLNSGLQTRVAETVEYYVDSHEYELARLLASIRIGWPELFATLDTNLLPLADPKAFMEVYRQSPKGPYYDVIKAAADLRLIHAAEITVVDGMLHVVDKVPSPETTQPLANTILFIPS